MNEQAQITALQRELKINQAIDDRMNKLLNDMQTMIDTTRIWESGLEVSQVQNLVAVAQETTSVEVVINYIRYQIGRDNNNSSWRRGSSPDSFFGEMIIAELNKLQEIAQSITGKDQAAADRAWITMTRRYLNYLQRYFYYKKRSYKENDQ